MKNANPVLGGGARWGQASGQSRSPGLAKASRVLLGVLLVAGLGPIGCAKEKAAAASVSSAAPKPIAHFFPIKVGDKTVRMQLAVTSAEMQHGLMGRRDLGKDDGMIFVYEKPIQMSFWMHNTPTPLDIGFFAPNGVLGEVYAMYPFDETSVKSQGDQLQFALEMNQGWYQANGVKPGAKLDLKALAAALKERGFDVKKFGLSE